MKIFLMLGRKLFLLDALLVISFNIACFLAGTKSDGLKHLPALLFVGFVGLNGIMRYYLKQREE